MDKFIIGGVEFFLSKQEVERKLNGVEPQPANEVYVRWAATGIQLNTRFRLQRVCCAEALPLTM